MSLTDPDSEHNRYFWPIINVHESPEVESAFDGCKVLQGQPVVLVQADAGGERKVRADPNEHRSPLGILEIELVLVHPAILGFQMPLFSAPMAVLMCCAPQLARLRCR